VSHHGHTSGARSDRLAGRRIGPARLDGDHAFRRAERFARDEASLAPPPERAPGHRPMVARSPDGLPDRQGEPGRARGPGEVAELAADTLAASNVAKGSYPIGVPIRVDCARRRSRRSAGWRQVPQADPYALIRRGSTPRRRKDRARFPPECRSPSADRRAPSSAAQLVSRRHPSFAGRRDTSPRARR
jgi:hypothetical protein